MVIKKRIQYVLILLGCLIAIPHSLIAQTNPPQSEHIDVRSQLSRGNLREGENLINTTRSGYQLYADVKDGKIVNYVVKDPNGNEVPYQQKRSSSIGLEICVTVYGVEICWEVISIPTSLW